MKSLVVFDLDGALALSKSSLDAEMAALLGRLFAIVKVAVISGGAWAQFEKQVLAFLPHDDHLSLSLLPTCGRLGIASLPAGLAASNIPQRVNDSTDGPSD
jgi:phosphomannomutase